MNKNQIIWEKWYCPFGQDDPEAESLLEQIGMNELLGEDDSISDESTMIPADEQKLSRQFSGQKFMITPMGVMPITDNTISTKIFNFWTGHTNFNISRNIANTIQSCEGVESLDVFTRYRFRISIGKAFKDSEVMNTINTEVYKTL